MIISTMSRGETKIDVEKYKHNEGYRQMIQNYFKDDLVQPFIKKDQKNPEFIKRYGTKFYKDKPRIMPPEVPEINNKKRVILHNSKQSNFA